MIKIPEPSKDELEAVDISTSVESSRAPERVALHYDEDRYDAGYNTFVPLALVASAIIAVGVGAYVYFSAIRNPAVSVATPAPPSLSASPYKAVYEQLGIQTLPANFERLQPKAVFPLDQLKREPCDSVAIIPLIEAIEDAGYPREAAKTAVSFTARCKFYSDVIDKAFWNFERVNDHTSALEVANTAVKEDEARGRYRFMRGTAHEGLKNYSAALSDYISTLQLFVDLSNVALSEFYRISRMYVAVGKPCDAITPLEMYLSYDVAKRQTAQLARLITGYANSGNCRAVYANGGDRLILGTNNIVEVTINGARGRLIVDTGASMVAITPSFATRARIVPDEQNMMTAEVVGGTVQHAPGYAQLMQVGNASAANVPVAISTGNDTAFGKQIDGLLGMTFLARFEIKLSAGVLELKPRVLN